MPSPSADAAPVTTDRSSPSNLTNTCSSSTVILAVRAPTSARRRAALAGSASDTPPPSAALYWPRVQRGSSDMFEHSAPGSRHIGVPQSPFRGKGSHELVDEAVARAHRIALDQLRHSVRLEAQSDPVEPGHGFPFD